MNTRAMRRLQSGYTRDWLISLSVSRVLTPEDHLKTFVLNAAAGITLTLPAALGSGTFLRLVVGTTITSNTSLVKTVSSGVFAGLIVASTDNATTTNNIWSAAATDNTITLDGSTRGGIKGDRIDLIDIASGVWQVTGWIASTGTEATPFSTV